MKRFSGTQKTFENETLPSAEDMEEMVMKSKGDADMNLNWLGVAVDGKKCSDFDRNLVRRIVCRNEEEIVDDWEKCDSLSSDNEDDDEHE